MNKIKSMLDTLWINKKINAAALRDIDPFYLAMKLILYNFLQFDLSIVDLERNIDEVSQEIFDLV